MPKTASQKTEKVNAEKLVIRCQYRPLEMNSLEMCT